MFDCVIPAAGASSRMGAFKPLLPFAGGTILGRTMATARAAGCRVILVVGNRADELRRLFQSEPDLVIVDNPAWEEGMLGSLQSALSEVRGERFFTIPADMPLVESAVYPLLATAQEDNREAGGEEAAFFAAHGGRKGHPVLIPSAWIADILALPRSGTMKSFLEGRRSLLVEAGSDAVLTDLDRPQEYQQALSRHSG